VVRIKKIIWDFSDTEFEDCNYEEARKIAVLPKSLTLKEDDIDSDAERDDIIEYLEENYNFAVKEVVTDLDD
jgi:hypothetical protein